MLTLLAGNRGRMPETKFDYANGYCPCPSQTRIVASWFNVCFREPAESVLLTTDHRHEIFDDQARKQFANRSPNYNPFGSSDAPLKFNDFDVFTKVGSFVQDSRA